MSTADPLFDLIRLLRPRATLWGTIRGAGRWGIRFAQADDIKFSWIEQGHCLLTRPDQEAILLKQGDFALVRTCMPFTLTSNVDVEPVDHRPAMEPRVLGTGDGSPVTVRGGKFFFDSINQNLLLNLLPAIVHIDGTAPSSWRVLSLLKLSRDEYLHPSPASEYVVSHIVELLLVEILRGAGREIPSSHAGLIRGLADPVTASALAAIHGAVAFDWTVERLARKAGVSRTSFATRFQSVMQTSPIEYLQQWRMALAKDALLRSEASVLEIAHNVGFASSSAFSKAFTRTAGVSPRAFTLKYR